MAQEPVLGSTAICAVKPLADANGKWVPVRLVADDAYDPPRLIVELPDRALRDLGIVDALLTGLAGDALQTVVAAGATVQIAADRYGRLKVARPKLSHASSNTTAITTATGTTVVNAPAASTHLRIWRFHASNSGATSTWVYLRDGAAGTRYYPTYLPTNGVISIRIDGGLDLTTATAAILTTSAAGNVEWHIEYETVAD
jgi:hypothetical protein